MAHLNEIELVDLVDGELPPSRAAHVAGCPECSAQLDALRATLAATRADADDEPSPLVWTTLPRRVAAAIDERQHPRWWLRPPILTALGSAAAVVILAGAVALWSMWAGVEVQAPDRPVAEHATAPAADDDDLEADAAWAVVRTAADDLEYDDALAAGISTAPSTADRAAMELSTEERAEFVRLISLEMKRTGP